MKNVFIFLLIGSVALSGSSCEPESLDDSQAADIHLSHDPIPVKLIGDYIPHVLPYTGKETPVINITPETVTLNLKNYTANLTLSDYRVIDNPHCWITIYLSDGSEIRLKYVYVDKYRWISVSLWRNGQREELGIFDKVTQPEM